MRLPATMMLYNSIEITVISWLIRKEYKKHIIPMKDYNYLICSGSNPSVRCKTPTRIKDNRNIIRTIIVYIYSLQITNFA